MNLRDKISQLCDIEYSYLSNFIEQNREKKIIAFGASVAGKHAVEFLSSFQIEVIFFVDNDKRKWGEYIGGVKVIPPDELNKFDKNHPILITSSYVNEIKEELINIGFNNIFNLPLIGNLIHTEELFDGNILRSNKENILSTYDILCDAKSQKTYFELLNCRMHGDFSDLSNIVDDSMYFPKDLIDLTSNEVFVDIGAYTGDTVKLFLDTVDNEYNKIIAYEPEPSNFSKLNEFCNNISNVITINKGVSHQTGEISFSKNMKMESSVAVDGELTIETVKLDEDLINENNISFVKMDIEGHEKSALTGMKRMIKKHRPIMAVCVYHRPTDIFQIPLFLKEINSNYSIYLYHHSISVTDTVCYAIDDSNSA
jgi:FkbM family methyltransferase